LDHPENRHRLAEWLGAQHQVVAPEAEGALGGHFDLCILDGPALDRVWAEAQARREAEQPVFLPFLLVTSREDLRVPTRPVWQNVDELIITPVEQVELQARVEVLLRARRISLELKRRLAQLVNYDALTGLPNRTLLHDRLSQALAQAQRNRRVVGVVFLDLDHFKIINNTLGHATGDRLLKAVAERLAGCVCQGDTVARPGGDEFTLMLPEVEDTQAVAGVAQRVLDTLAAPFELDGREVFVAASLGIALSPFDGDDAETLLKNADTATYQAKKHGRNNYQFYSAEMNVKAFERLALETSLRRALEREELLVHYQPQVDLSTGRVVGTEVLVRWQHPHLGLVSPTRFIPLAEETGLIAPIGEWVLRTACAQNKSWQQAGYAPLCVAVNLSVRQFKQANLVQTVERVIRETGLDPRYLELELTESIFMQNAKATIQTLRELKEMGVKLSIDDFGTGYSSLSYLQRFPIDALKIDQSFVRDITTDPSDAAIGQAIISMAHSLRLKVVAEGVETEEQLAFLQRDRCDQMQGYYFSRPLPVEAFTQLLQEGRRLQIGQRAVTSS
jgi:diguanylate cyclase (GGDEF)-like protein